MYNSFKFFYFQVKIYSTAIFPYFLICPVALNFAAHIVIISLGKQIFASVQPKIGFTTALRPSHETTRVFSLVNMTQPKDLIIWLKAHFLYLYASRDRFSRPTGNFWFLRKKKSRKRGLTSCLVGIVDAIQFTKDIMERKSVSFTVLFHF